MEIFDRFKEIISLNDNKTPVVLELGANDGYHSECMINMLKERNDGKFIFHAFEPEPSLHKHATMRIGRALQNNKRGIASFVPKAIGNADGTMKFYKSEGIKKGPNGEIEDRWYGSSSLLKPTEQISKDFKGMYFDEIEVEVITMDNFIKDAGLNGDIIDFIWSDIQGCERIFIEGATNTLDNTRYLYTEYSEAVHYEGQLVGLQEMLDMLPGWIVIEDYGGDVLLKNTNINK